MIEQNSLQTSPALTKRGSEGLSIFEVNFIYLLTMGLVIILGSFVQAWSPFFGLILTEIFLILLPTLLFMTWKKQMTFTGLRLTWPGSWVALSAILAGLGLNLFTTWLSVLLLANFGYSSAYGASLVPKDLPQAYLTFLGFAIFAPLCEEILFRGVILRGYEARGFWRSIVTVAVLFAAYHLSLPRFIAILPVALALNWTASRSHSIGSSMLMHFGNNGVSALLLILSVILPGYQPAWYGAFPSAGVGLLLAAAALVLIDRLTRSHAEGSQPTESQAPESQQSLSQAAIPQAISSKEATRPVTRQQAIQISAEVAKQRASRIDGLFVWDRDWPLVIALVLVLGMALADFVVGRSPGLLITQRLALHSTGIDTPATWHYELRNAGDQVIGKATCQRTAQVDRIHLDCEVHQEAYQLHSGNSFYQDTTYDRRLRADWDPVALNLIHLDSRTSGQQVNNAISVDVGASKGLTLKVSWGGETQIPLALPADSLYQDEWPWRLMGLPFSDGYGGKTSLAYPMIYNDHLDRSALTQMDSVAMVYSKETVSVPAGSYNAWKVNLDKSSAWYDTAAPHTLVKYTDGMTTYLLDVSQ